MDDPAPVDWAPLTAPFAFSDFWLHIDRLRDILGNRYRALESLGYDHRTGLNGKVHCDAIHALSAEIAACSTKRVKFIDPISVGHIRSIGSRASVDEGAEFARRPSLCFDICTFDQVHFICRLDGNHWLLALFEAVVELEFVVLRLSILDSLIDSSECGGYVVPDKEALVGDLR